MIIKTEHISKIVNIITGENTTDKLETVLKALTVKDFVLYRVKEQRVKACLRVVKGKSVDIKPNNLLLSQLPQKGVRYLDYLLIS